MEVIEFRLRSLASHGVFGAGDLVQIENAQEEGKGLQLMSEMFFFLLTLRENGSTKKLSIAVKVQLKTQRIYDFRTDIQFANEVAMYGTILPELGASEYHVSPEMFHGEATNGEDFAQDIIVMEDLRASGYKIAENLFLDYDHVMLAMRKLGEFHGLSYRMKRNCPLKFAEFCKMLRPRKYKFADGLFEGALYRGFAPIIGDHQVAKIAHDKLFEIFINGNGKSINNPDEPFAVIIHGDFNRNNLLFKYDDNKKAVKVKFVDFGVSLYADPAVDLSFFLYMNTSEEVRKKYWEDFLLVYWEGVTSVGDPGFKFEQFTSNFAKRAIWGYVPCCFFLPKMMFLSDVLKEEGEVRSFEEKRKFGLTSGGEEATKAVCSIARHLLDMGYLDEFVDNF